MNGSDISSSPTLGECPDCKNWAANPLQTRPQSPSIRGNTGYHLNPNVAYLCRGKTRKSVSDVAAHRLGQVEAYFTVREVLSEASTLAPPQAGLSRERSGFYRCRYATLGLPVLKPFKSGRSHHAEPERWPNLRICLRLLLKKLLGELEQVHKLTICLTHAK